MTQQRMLELLILGNTIQAISTMAKDNPEFANNYDLAKMEIRETELLDEFLQPYVKSTNKGVTSK